MKAYKGFDKNLRCNPTGSSPFQYEIGRTYTEEHASVCNYGFHACENPLDVLSYYKPGDNSRYCEVELDDVVRSPGEKDTKVAAKKIKIGAEIGIKGIIQAALKFGFECAESSKDITATTGDRAYAATAGNYTHAATAGNFARAATAGNFAHAATTGSYAHAEVKGKDSIAAALGINGHVKGVLGSILVCAEWHDNDLGQRELRDVKTARVDGKQILPDVWYTLRGGEFVQEEP